MYNIIRESKNIYILFNNFSWRGCVHVCLFFFNPLCSIQSFTLTTKNLSSILKKYF